MARTIRLTMLTCLVLLLVGCDHATKLLAARTLANSAPASLVPGLVELRYTENHDVAFSLLRSLDVPDKRWMLAGLAMVGVAFLFAVVWSRRRVASRLELWGWGAMIGGAIGNVLDRVVRGFVVDFVRLPHWPVFNLADVFIVVGFLLVIIARRRRRAAA